MSAIIVQGIIMDIDPAMEKSFNEAYRKMMDDIFLEMIEAFRSENFPDPKIHTPSIVISYGNGKENNAQ